MPQPVRHLKRRPLLGWVMMRAISATTSPVSAETMKIVNTRLVAKAEQLASARGVTLAQIALTWLHHRSKVHGLSVVPIPRNPQAALFIREGSPSETYSPTISRPRAIRRSLAKFSEAEASNHTPSLANFTTTMMLQICKPARVRCRSAAQRQQPNSVHRQAPGHCLLAWCGQRAEVASA